MRAIILIPVLLLAICSCRKQHLEPGEYRQYVEDPENGLQQAKAIGKCKYTVQYKPIDYMVMNETKGKVLRSLMEKKESEMSGLQYYSLKLSPTGSSQDIMMMGLSSEQEYYSRVNYSSFEMQEDVFIVEGNDTLQPVLFHFENNYGLKPSADWTLAFEKKNEDKEDKTFVIEDRLFGNGTIKFEIKKDAIDAAPSIIKE